MKYIYIYIYLYIIYVSTSHRALDTHCLFCVPCGLFGRTNRSVATDVQYDFGRHFTVACVPPVLCHRPITRLSYHGFIYILRAYIYEVYDNRLITMECTTQGRSRYKQSSNFCCHRYGCKLLEKCTTVHTVVVGISCNVLLLIGSMQWHPPARCCFFAPLGSALDSFHLISTFIRSIAVTHVTGSKLNEKHILARSFLSSLTTRTHHVSLAALVYLFAPNPLFVPFLFFQLGLFTTQGFGTGSYKIFRVFCYVTVPATDQC